MKARCLFIGGPVDGQWREVDDKRAGVEVADHIQFTHEELEKRNVALEDSPFEKKTINVAFYMRERYFVGHGKVESIFIYSKTHEALTAMKLLFDNYKPKPTEEFLARTAKAITSALTNMYHYLKPPKDELEFVERQIKETIAHNWNKSEPSEKH